jgi:polyhydroxyalkanoate synthesis regulator phasin
MKKKLFESLLVGIIVLMITGLVFAAGIEDAIKGQQKAIDTSIASKSLTKQEVDIVRANLNRIKDKYGRLKAEGKLTDIEQEKLNNMLDKNNKMIMDKKNHPIKPIYKPDAVLRFESQQKRIDNGIASGTLTKEEAKVVQDNLNRIKTKYTKMKADGTLTDAEEEKLHIMLDKNYNMIFDKKKNLIRKID